jgi:protein-tyrosine-phosphatase
MAEGFARCYGSDVMTVASAGLAPAAIVQLLTKKVMLEKNIDLEGTIPKDLSSVDVSSFDLIINMSGNKLPETLPIEVRDWKVEDPIGRTEDVYCEVRDRIERLVMNLVMELRKPSGPSAPPKPGRRFLGRVGTR